MLLQELRHQRRTLGIEELWRAVFGTVNHLEVDRQFVLLVDAMQLVRLIDWHLRILITVQQKQRRILRVDMKHRARQLG